MILELLVSVLATVGLFALAFLLAAGAVTVRFEIQDRWGL